MLFPYKYVSHQMEKMQEFIDFIFHNVWCKAPSSGPFRLELFDGSAVLKGLMTLFQVGDTQAGDFFYGHVDRIYGHFAAISLAQAAQRIGGGVNQPIDPGAPFVRVGHGPELCPVGGLKPWLAAGQ